MNRFVRFVTLMLIVVITNPTQAGTQHEQSSRYEKYGNILPKLSFIETLTQTSGGYTATYTPWAVTRPDGAGVRIVLTASDGTGVPQSIEPTCAPQLSVTYSDSTGDYATKCKVLVFYIDGSDFQPYDPTKKSTPIVQFALDTIWTKNGVEINPTKTLVPELLGDSFYFRLYSDSYTVKGYMYQGSWGLNTTALDLYVDDVVYATGDDAVINYSWKVSPGLPFISAMNTKMYMEQIDSNIAMSYVKPDGTGAAVIVPNTKITLEDNSKGLTSNGQIKLKLDRKTEFGTRSSRLRVTVEWQ